MSAAQVSQMGKEGRRSRLPTSSQNPPISASATTTFTWATAFTAIAIGTLIIAAVATAGMVVLSVVLADNVSRIDDRISATRKELQGLINNVDDVEDDVAYINETMAVGNGTVFFDDEWVMVNGPDPDKQFMFDASLLLTSGFPNRRNYALPNSNGTFALRSNIPGLDDEYSEDVFALFASGDNTTRAEFDLSALDAGQTRYLYLPNNDGVIAMFDDLHTLIYHPNQSIFLDSKFMIEHDDDTSKKMMLDASQLIGDHLYVFPDMNGTIVVTEGAQTVMDKTLPSNSTLLSSATGTAQLDLDALAMDRVYFLTDRDQTLIGRDGIDWAPESMGWSPSTGTYSYIRVASEVQRDRFMQFTALGAGSGGNVGRAGIDFSWFDLHNYRMWTGVGGGFALTYSQAGIPTINNDLGDPILLIQPLSGVINFVDRTDGAKRARFDISGLTTIQNFALPDKTGIFLTSTGALQRNSTFDDATFEIYNDVANSKVGKVDAAGISSGFTRMYGLPNDDGVFLLREIRMGWRRESARFTTTFFKDIPSSTGNDGSLVGYTPLQWFAVSGGDPNNNIGASAQTYDCPRAGLYTFTAQVTWEPTGTRGLRAMAILFFRGGLFQGVPAWSRKWTLAINEPIMNRGTSGAINMQAGDSVAVYVAQGSGSTIYIDQGQENTFFAATYHGPL